MLVVSMNPTSKPSVHQRTRSSAYIFVDHAGNSFMRLLSILIHFSLFLSFRQNGIGDLVYLTVVKGDTLMRHAP